MSTSPSELAEILTERGYSRAQVTRALVLGCRLSPPEALHVATTTRAAADVRTTYTVPARTHVARCDRTGRVVVVFSTPAGLECGRQVRPAPTGE